MGKIAFLFAGQGAQYPGMGKDLYEKISICENVFEIGESLRPGTIKQCFDSDEETLKQTVNTQPCLFLTDLACARALEGAGIKADYAAGFSLGEIAALPFSGILSEEEAFRLVTLRGEKMDECAGKHPGSMAAVLRMSNEAVEALCKEFPDVYPVNYNCPGQLVVAGGTESINAFMERVKEEKGRAIPLAVSGAFHTPFMKEASGALKDMLCKLEPKTPSIPLIANLDGAPYPAQKDEIIARISAQCANPVRFEDTLRYLAKEGVDTFIEVGPGKTLSGFVKKTLEDVRIFNVSDMESLNETVSALKES
ncbi:MAG: ACP S-malonyltransferase [Lachnospiraceae bacterium]|nr:ACP S-malonyltransferase [Lachnospiraceae bacterium]